MRLIHHKTFINISIGNNLIIVKSVIYSHKVFPREAIYEKDSFNVFY